MSNPLIIFVNTDDRASGTVSDAQWHLSSELPATNLMNYNLSLQTCEFAHLVYPFNSSRGNQILYWQEDSDAGTTYSATIPENAYSGSGIATQLTTLMNAGTGNAYVYTWTYDSTSKRLTVSEASDSAFRIWSGVGNQDCNREIGFDKTDINFKTASFTLPWPVDLSGTKYVDILTNLANMNQSTTLTSNTLFRIPVTSSFGTIIFHQSFSDDSLYVANDSLSSFRLQLRDDRGRRFILPENASVSYTIRCVPSVN